MQATDRAVTVEAGRQAVSVQDLPETTCVRRQLGRLHGRVLDKRQRPAGTGARRHEQPQACLTNLQQRGLFRRVRRPERVVAVAVGPPAFLQTAEPGHRLGLAVAEERHEQQGLRIAVQDRAERGVFDLLAGQLDDGAVEQLDGPGLAGQRVLGRLDGRLHGYEVAHRDGPVPWRGHQLDRGLHHGDQGALGAHHELGQVEPGGLGQARRPRQPVQPVAAGLPPEPGEPGGDGLPVAFDQAGQLPADRPVEGRRARAAEPFSGGQRAERDPAGVGQHHVERVHVIDRHAVSHRLAARRVVADHSAERGPVPG